MDRQKVASELVKIAKSLEAVGEAALIKEYVWRENYHYIEIKVSIGRRVSCEVKDLLNDEVKASRLVSGAVKAVEKAIGISNVLESDVGDPVVTDAQHNIVYVTATGFVEVSNNTDVYLVNDTLEYLRFVEG